MSSAAGSVCTPRRRADDVNPGPAENSVRESTAFGATLTLDEAMQEAARVALAQGNVDGARVLSVGAADAATVALGASSAGVVKALLTCVDVEEKAGDFEAARQWAARAAEVAAEVVKSDDAELVDLWVDVEVVHARWSSELDDA